MSRRFFLRAFSLIAVSGALHDLTCAQMPIGPLVANASPDLKSIKSTLSIKQPSKPSGTLLLCGGGTIPLAIREEFYRMGKGIEGTLVLIPTASPRSDAGDYSMWIDYWSSFRWKQIEVVHAADHNGAFNPSMVEKLRKATAVWVSGGEQKRLSERYVDTSVEKELHAVLARGGIVGGTSAGAAIASSTMIADGIIEPQFAAGLHFLPGTIIDQHFSQRKRHGRLLKAIEAHPNRIGIGIDESTGLFVDKNESRVVGDGGVFLLNSVPSESGSGSSSDGYHRLQAGEVLKTQLWERQSP
jgi:cyanophycinase